MQTRQRAQTRFGLGASLQASSASRDPVGWVRDQLSPDAGRPELVAAADWTPLSLEELFEAFSALQAAQRSRDQDAARTARMALNAIQEAEASAALTTRVRSERPFVERLVAFWSNHLCVSAARNARIGVLAGHYERTVIRPNVLGSFQDMVLASARHPAMLLYLDNAQSVGPDSRIGVETARRGRARGLNENYARELLELHTLGVDGGYEQADVRELAKVLTGWSVSGVGPGSRRAGSPAFSFRELAHQPGPKTVLGVRYGEAGEREGRDVIRALCRHPSTARFVAYKLVRHFVADDPPRDDVEQIAGVYRETGGDLRAVSLALVELESAWADDNKKFRSPQDWLIASLRALDVDELVERAPRPLRALRHRMWAPLAPKGFGDTRREWDDPDALMNRAELSRTFARAAVRARGRELDPEALLVLFDDRDADALSRVVRDRSVSRPDRIATVLASPTFQWR